MFKLNLKIALRNLWKNKGYTALNIFGLAAGLSGALIILVYINFETGYDKWDPSLKQVYQVGIHTVRNGEDKKTPEIDGHFVKMVRDQIPEVENISMGSWENVVRNFDYVYNNRTIHPEFTFGAIDREFLKIYPIQAVKGRMEDVFTGQNAIAISKTKALAIFGKEDPINKVITRKGGANFKDEDAIVKAVYDDSKYRSYFGTHLFMISDTAMYGDEAMDASYNVMLKLGKNADVNSLTARINDAYLQLMAKRMSNNSDPNFKLSTAKATEILKKEGGITTFQVIIEPVSDLNLSSYFSADPKQNTIFILTALASFLIIISCVNFTNLAVVQAAARAKEVGVKKVLGAYRWDLARQFIAETGLQCLIAFFIALIITELSLPTLNGLLDANILLFSNPAFLKLMFQGFIILLGIIVLSGLYPAMILSGFTIAKVLKGNFSTGSGAVTLRKSLVVLQFTIAGALIICFMVMKAQLSFMRDSTLGMEPNQLMNFGVQIYKNRQLNHEQFDQVKQRLKKIEGVMDVSRSTNSIVGAADWKADVNLNGVTTSMSANYSDLDYFKALKAEFIDGRDFSQQFLGADTTQNVILNETAARSIGLKDPVGTPIDIVLESKSAKFNIIGIVKDIKNQGFDKAVTPTVYLMTNFQWKWRKSVVLRLSSNNISKTIESVKKEWKTFEPDMEPKYSFADDKFAEMNAGYERMAKIMFSFSAITFFVAMLGLFTLAAYNSKVRLKEIAIRKILGASTGSILKLLNADLVKLVLIANIIADVVAYIYMNQWFKAFVYRVEMPWVLFITINILTTLLTILTVSMQSIRSAKASPVAALKYE
ncbi:MAG: ABC transporter permease [Pedobacter sp.]|nr:MAG: ABC transporter permease [Pedobacter sp.]